MAQPNKRTQYDLMHPLFKTMREAKLPSTDRLFLLGLFRFVDGDGVGYPSYSAIQDETGLSRRTISSCIKRLSESDWLTYTQGSQAKQLANTYKLNLAKLGLIETPKPKLQVIDNRYPAEDGKYYDSPAEYYKAKEAAKNAIK